MALLEFLRRAPARDLRAMLLLALVAGVANALLVVAVNGVTALVAADQRPGVGAWAGFAAAFAVYYAGNRMALLRANVVIERLLKALRLRVMDRLRRSELTTVDSLGRGNLYNLVSQETNHLSVTFPLIVDGGQQAILLAMSLVYLATLSPPALGAFLVAVAAAAAGFRMIAGDFRRAMDAIQSRQARMLDAIGDIIHGAKELRLNERRSEDVFALYRALSHAVRELQVRVGGHWAALLLLGALATYGMLGVVAFAFPDAVPGFGTVVLRVVPVLLFCIGPLYKLASQAPMYLRAEVGLRAILDIDRRLAAAGSVAPAEARANARLFADFRSIACEGLVFHHRDAAGAPLFGVGPLDLSVRRGELVFVVGGNGSGKSTALRLLCGLLRPEAGTLKVDGAPVEGAGLAGYRELFSAIFVDFHLFDRLYGLEDVDPAEVERRLAEMGLAGKVRLADGRFSQTALSTGQRKRLALITALLEDRPVYVFDEWSAEQDGHFRAYFYTRVLPELKARGKTVIAVTHDERYWRVADRVVRMDLGRVEWDRPGG